MIKWERLLATLVWGLTGAIVICVEIVMARSLIGHDHDWAFVLASTVFALVVALYARGLARRLHRNDRPRWRLSVTEADSLLPWTLFVFWVTLGLAASTYWPDWMGAAIGGCAVAALSQYCLQRVKSKA